MALLSFQPCGTPPFGVTAHHGLVRKAPVPALFAGDTPAGSCRTEPKQAGPCATDLTHDTAGGSPSVLLEYRAVVDALNRLTYSDLWGSPGHAMGGSHGS